jgi:S-DNA-T family DNA segregation ATPase FtsK/SpoIIIE
VITEFAIAGVGVALYRNMDKIKLRSKWKQITYSKSEFTNKLEKTLKVWRIDRASYGYDIITELPYGYTFENLTRDLDIFKEGLHFQSIQLENKNNIVIMHCVVNYCFKDYTPIE